MQNIRRITLLLIVAIATALALPTLAQDAASVRATAEQSVNLRTGPGIIYTVRGTIGAFGEETLTVTGRSNFAEGRVCRGDVIDLSMWLRVDYEGVEAWVNRCVVSINGEVDTLPVAEPVMPRLVSEQEASRAVSIPGVTADPDKVIGFTRGGPINVRAAGSLEADVNFVVGDVVAIYITGTNADASWMQVEFGDGASGWIASYLLQLPRDWQEDVAVIG